MYKYSGVLSVKCAGPVDSRLAIRQPARGRRWKRTLPHILPACPRLSICEALSALARQGYLCDRAFIGMPCPQRPPTDENHHTAIICGISLARARRLPRMQREFR